MVGVLDLHKSPLPAFPLQVTIDRDTHIVDAFDSCHWERDIPRMRGVSIVQFPDAWATGERPFRHPRCNRASYEHGSSFPKGFAWRLKAAFCPRGILAAQLVPLSRDLCVSCYAKIIVSRDADI